MAVLKVNITPPALTCSAVAADTVCPHKWLSAKPLCCFLVILYNDSTSYKLPAALFKMISPWGRMVAWGLRRECLPQHTHFTSCCGPFLLLWLPVSCFNKKKKHEVKVYISLRDFFHDSWTKLHVVKDLSWFCKYLQNQFTCTHVGLRFHVTSCFINQCQCVPIL